ncbi:MAG TPA: hypothetical protein VLX85_10045 [Stellaceae bacterium]|nr:hypothetical protein [Stellaceae bacterium]
MVDPLCSPRRCWLALAIAFAALLGGCASPTTSVGPLHFAATKVGFALVDDQGMTLYTYDRDTSGVPTCTGDCADLWPPELAAADARFGERTGVAVRPDGLLQWTYDGKPLYRYAGDVDPGDAYGDGLLGLWHAVMR